MRYWLVSSKDVGNIKRACERLIWGFWDRETGEKQRKNWRSFVRIFNTIKPFDVFVFQVAKTGELHGIGIVKETYYDDQTPIWEGEVKQNRVLFPWRVSLCTMLFSEEPFMKHFIRIENYIDGYGIGEIPEHEFRKVLQALKSKLGVELSL